MSAAVVIVGLVAAIFDVWAGVDAFLRQEWGFTRAGHSRLWWMFLAVLGGAFVLGGGGLALVNSAPDVGAGVAAGSGLALQTAGAALGFAYLAVVRPRVRFYNRCRCLKDLRLVPSEPLLG